LKQHPGAPVRVYAVWLPILVSDVAPPITWVLGRMGDRRVQQYWDPSQLVAKQMARDARTPQPEPDCCDSDGTPWDLAAVYRKGVVWTDRMPPAALFNGPVVDIRESLSAAISGQR
jgi:hypothetical protein